MHLVCLSRWTPSQERRHNYRCFGLGTPPPPLVPVLASWFFLTEDGAGRFLKVTPHDLWELGCRGIFFSQCISRLPHNEKERAIASQLCSLQVTQPILCTQINVSKIWFPFCWGNFEYPHNIMAAFSASSEICRTCLWVAMLFSATWAHL